MADPSQPTVLDLAIMASPAYQRAKRAADDFTAGMNRLVKEAGESSESAERLRVAVQRIADGGPSGKPLPGEPFTHQLTNRSVSRVRTQAQ